MPKLRQALATRSERLRATRAYFDARGLVEVDTPALSPYASTDLHLHSMRVHPTTSSSAPTHYLHTSPELPLKRLLAHGSGDVYQLSHVFRADEVGRWHQPEFMMLEWYRVGWDHHALMQEVDHWLQTCFGCPPAATLTYQEAVEHVTGCNPHTATLADWATWLSQTSSSPRCDDLHTALDWVFSEHVQPRLTDLTQARVVMVHGFPACQAALARCEGGVASRFEVFLDTIELGNGFHELTDPDEQRRRFAADNHARRAHHLLTMPVDTDFLDALEQPGLPACAGVAIGMDRLFARLDGMDRLSGAPMAILA